MLILGFRSVEFQQTHQKISFLTINNLIIFKGNQQGEAGLCDSMNYTALKRKGCCIDRIINFMVYFQYSNIIGYASNILLLRDSEKNVSFCANFSGVL